ncbi:MAG TPA: hypothetical protein VKR54_05230 [Candidatus Babeliales bacterium]|jgi:hypothetical protein|nr:hypothetical protein [Candidatus Babeliales bacterium]
MKNSNFLFLPLIVAITGSFAAERPLQMAEINKKAEAIETKLTRERYFVYGLTVLGVAHELYQWFPLLNTIFGANPVEAPVQEKKSLFEAFKSGLNFLFYTQEGWVSMAQSALGIGGFVMISKVGDKLVHPDTLNWYMHTYAPYPRTIELMQERLLELQSVSLNPERRAAHKEFLHMLYDRLVRQSEAICAYMMYKSKRLAHEEKALAQRSVRSMVSFSNNWLLCIATQLNADNPNYEEISRLIAAYQADVTCHLNHFSIIEGETLRERSAIKRQLQQK